VLRQFEPQLILVSAGFDAHERDPLAGMRVTTPHFGRLTAQVAEIADEVCDGRVVAVTEGGYDLHALADSLRAAVRALSGELQVTDTRAPEGPARRGDAALAEVLPHLRRFWKL
jgi:acetoin utilization deacetylase AcuC-like enzyme